MRIFSALQVFRRGDAICAPQVWYVLSGQPLVGTRGAKVVLYMLVSVIFVVNVFNVVLGCRLSALQCQNNTRRCQELGQSGQFRLQSHDVVIFIFNELQP